MTAVIAFALHLLALFFMLGVGADAERGGRSGATGLVLVAFLSALLLLALIAR